MPPSSVTVSTGTIERLVAAVRNGKLDPQLAEASKNATRPKKPQKAA
jgi:hypothetical protein